MTDSPQGDISWGLAGAEHEPKQQRRCASQPAKKWARPKKFTCPRRPQRLIQQLERRQVQLAQQARALEQQHSRLQQEHQVLVSCCDGLQSLRLQQSDAVAQGQTLRDFVDEEELRLLQMLQNTPYSNLHKSASAGISSDPVSDSAEYPALSSGSAVRPEDAAATAQYCIGSPDNVMQYFQQQLTAPPFPGAENVTALDLSLDYAATVQQMALQLHLLKVPDSLTQSNPLQRIKSLIDRHFNLITTLILSGHSDVVEAFVLTNFDTLEPLEEPCMKRHAWLVQQAGFSDHQKATIVQGIKLFTRLLTPIIIERQQQLQQQMTADSDQLQQEQPSRPSSSGSGRSRSSGSDSLADVVHCLEQQQKRAARLARLLRKEYITISAAGSWVIGCMTYLQLAQMAVLASPFPMKISLLGKVLLDEQRQQQIIIHTTQP